VIPLYIIGDSHTRLYFSTTNRADPLIVQREVVGPCECISETRYIYAGMSLGGFSEETASSEERVFLGHLAEYLQGKTFDNVGLIFGEVDIRWHVVRELKEKKLEESLGSRLAVYEAFIARELAPRVAGKIVVFGGIPYSRRYSEAVNHPDGVLNVYARRLDETLSLMCAAHRWYHLSIFDEVLGPDGYLDPQYLNRDESECTIHLEPSLTKAIVAEKLNRIFDGSTNHP